MPSLAESKRQVKNALKNHTNDLDHDAILASLQDEIDRHNNRDEDLQSSGDERAHRRRDRREDGSSLKFRFKSGTSDPRDKKRKHRHRDSHREHRKHRKAKRESEHQEEAAHPFPREPVEADRDANADSTTAFRESLFDALADDEGAAYWESVYSQPIHVYPRPTVERAKGELEEMNDDEYAAYVQTKMWEKKNPHIVLERDCREKQRREEEEERTRQREEFVRRKQRAAWERAERESARKFAGLDGDAEDYEYVFDFEAKTGSASKRTSDAKPQQREYSEAWKRYLAAWNTLKQELLDDKLDGEQKPKGKAMEPSKRIPWPVLQSKPATSPNIKDFMWHVPVEEGTTKLQILKSERVKWHPDKVQQRFGGQVDDGTMKLVTGVFQVVDGLLEEERKKA